MEDYPKVLLFGHSFNNYSGMGITLNNLFVEWPKDKIAVWANEVDSKLCDTIRPCAIYIGHAKSTNRTQQQKTNTIKNRIRENLRTQYRKIGIFELQPNITISENELELAKSFDPDIVFCALGSDVAMLRCEKLMDSLPHAKLVLYIVDDWVNTKINTRYFSSYWRKKYDKDFRHILERATGLLSICQYMSDEYLKMYGKTFYPFHNPVNLAEWQIPNVESKYPADKTSILYVGKINDDTTPCLIDMCHAVQKVNAQGGSYVFDIYSPDHNQKLFLFEGNDDVHAYPPIAHEGIPQLMKSYSALFLPLGFSKQSRSYVRLSMPTKLSEYLACGKPIILYCPKEIALAKYLSDKNCAIMCNNNDENILGQAILKLQDKKVYKQLVDNSLVLAAQHEGHEVRQRFKHTLCSFL